MGAIGDRLLAEVGAARVFSDLGFDLEPLAGASEGSIKCPFHNERNGFALSVNLDTGICHCFGRCSRGWDAVQAFGQIRGIPEGPALYKAIEAAYLSNGNGSPPPARPAPVARSDAPAVLDRYLASVMAQARPLGSATADLYEVRRYEWQNGTRGLLFAVRDPSSGLLCDIKRRQLSPKPDPAFKSVSASPFCRKCGRSATSKTTCKADHPAELVRAHAGLFGLLALKKHASYRVLFAAGEKDAIRAAEMLAFGIVPVSWSAGEGSDPKGCADLLRDRETLFLYDDDEAGRSGSVDRANYMKSQGVALVAPVHWASFVDPPLDHEAGQKDLFDWFQKGGSARDAARCLLSVPLRPREAQRGPEGVSDDGSLSVAPAASGTVFRFDDPIDPKEPYEVARGFVLERAWVGGMPSLRHFRDDWYDFTGNRYALREPKEIRKRVNTFLVDHGCQPKEKLLNEVVGQTTLATLLPDRGNPPFWIERKEDDPVDNLIAFKNCLYDPERDETYPHSPRYFGLNPLPFDYDPGAPEPREWLRFLDSLWRNDVVDDPASIAHLREIMGYILAPVTRLHVMFLFLGVTRGGKGVISSELLPHLLGPENCAHTPMASLVERFGLQVTIGKALQVIPDARFSSKADKAVPMERILSLSAADSITIDRKNRDPWTGKPTARIVMVTNETPKLEDFSGAFISRLVPIHFQRSFAGGKEDPFLADRLKVEAPGILNWALEGRRTLFARGRFDLPGSAILLKKRVAHFTNPLAGFLSDICEVGPGQRAKTRAVYSAYTKWCEDQNRRHEMTRDDFAERLMTAAPGIVLDKKADEFVGVGLRPEAWDTLYQRQA